MQLICKDYLDGLKNSPIQVMRPRKNNQKNLSRFRHKPSHISCEQAKSILTLVCLAPHPHIRL